MRNLKRIRLLILLAVAALVFAPLATTSAQETSEQVIVPPGQTIKIGWAGDRSGPLIRPGEGTMYGAQAAVDLRNAAGGILGFQVELLRQDDGCDPAQAPTVAQQYASNPEVVGVVGHLCSGATNAAAAVYEQFRIVMVSPSSTAFSVTAQDRTVVNRVAVNDNLQGTALARFMVDELGLATLAVLDDGGAYGQGLADKVAEEFAALGGEVTFRGNLDPAQDNYRPLLTNLLANPPEALFFGGYEVPGAALTTQKNEVGLTDMIFIGADGVQTTLYIEQAGADGEGQYASSVVTPLDDPRLDEFRAAWEAAAGGARYDDYGPYQPQGHDAAAMILDGIAAVATLNEDGALVIDREALIAAVRATAGFDGLTGTLTCDENGDCGAGQIAIYQVQNGQWVTVATYTSDELMGLEMEATPEAGSGG